jgi:hypothetical protein
MRRRRLWASVALAAALGALVAFVPGREVQAGSPRPTVTHGPPVVPIAFDGDLRDLPRLPQAPAILREPGEHLGKAVQAPPAPRVPATPPNMPPAIASFNGMSLVPDGFGTPPDPVGDVDAAYYFQAVNASFAIFDKTTGATVVPPVSFNALWSGAGTFCEGHNYGDPTVVHDPIGNRWIVADFAFTGIRTRPFYECIAVSKTSDPVGGGWWLYAVRTDDDAHPWFVDYPKMGIWPDGLYMSANLWDESVTPDVFREARLWAFDRTSLEAGGPLAYVVVDLDSLPGAGEYFTLLPATVGPLPAQLPPAGRDELFVGESATAMRLNVFTLHPDYTGSGTTLSGPANVSEAAYTLADPPPRVPSPANSLDSLTDQLMAQAQYRRIGGSESIWVNHSVEMSANGPYGVHWLQLDVTGGAIAPAPAQQQIYGDVGGDGVHRWLGSVDVDRNGDLALGYSASSASLNPEIRYSGRLASDPPGTLGQGEATLFAGDASETGGLHRWGDYSSMTLDPDGCTFWYTNEYYSTSDSGWHTRIGSFAFPSCLTPTAAGVLAFTVRRGVLSWRTANEARIAGFDTYRGEGKLNRALIRARHTGRVQGGSYRFADRSGGAGRYRLEVVLLDGMRRTIRPS